jgi:hypothetical protein
LDNKTEADGHAQMDALEQGVNFLILLRCIRSREETYGSTEK